MADEVLDQAALLEECDDDMDFLTHMVEIFDRDRTARLQRLSEAIAAGDCETVMNEAHALKGGVGVLSGRASFETAKSLEMMGRSQDLSDAVATLQKLESDLEDLRRALGELLQSSSGT